MGQFANTIFSGLLGWVQTAMSWLWGLATNADVSAWFRWVLDNWLPLTLILCGAGLAIDFIVYLLRWQPYRVWRGFLKRITGRTPKDGAQDELLPYQRKWIYADGSTTLEDIRQTQQLEKAPAGTDRLELPIRPVRRVNRNAPPEQAYYQPVYPPQWQSKTKDNQGGNE